jgi:hypothetical protein
VRLLSFSLIELNPKVLMLLANSLKDKQKQLKEFPDMHPKLSDIGYSHTDKKNESNHSSI